MRAALQNPRRRFVAIATLGFLLVLIQTLRGSNEVFDFWEHAATVRQLMLHPWRPANALIASPAPSAFYSPYTLLVAMGGRLADAGAVHTLAVAGLINYWLLIVAVWYFTRVFSSRRETPFYALAFIWLLWGVSPWKYSGFFNLRSLSEVIAYPSTFATATGMLTAALWSHITRDRQGDYPLAGDAPLALLATIGLAATVITHPVAGAATGSAMVAISVTAADPRRSIFALLLAATGAALLCAAWPYYSFTRLLDDQSVFDPTNSVMYSSWLTRAFPALAALALAGHRTGTLRRGRLAIYTLPLVALYIYGGVSKHYSDGRVISYIIIGAQIGLADLAGAYEQNASRHRGRARSVALTIIVLVTALELVNMRGGLRGSLPGTGSPSPVYQGYRDAVEGLAANATIATPLNDGAEVAIPAYAGRLIGTHRPLAFVRDQTQRQQTLNAFFSPAATATYRTEIINHYRVRYIVVPATDGALLAQLANLATPIRHDPLFDTLLVKTLRTSPTAP